VNINNNYFNKFYRKTFVFK